MSLNAEPKIQVVTTKGNLTAWLVEVHSLPMISVEVAFRAGSAYDPEDKQGLAQLAASLLDEGAGDMDATAFQNAVEAIGARFGASAGKLELSVNMSTLTDKKEDAFNLLGLALTQPRFDSDALQRIKEAMLANLKRAEEQPSSVAARAFQKALYGDHPYGHLTDGTEESVHRLTRQDVEAFHKKNLTQANMVISVVGDMTPEELAKLLDEALASLLAGEEENAIATGPDDITPTVVRIEKNTPQASIVFGHLGISREDPDYYAALVMNHTLGGGGLTSRMMEEVREKRGLAYDVRSYFVPMPHRGAFIAQVQTNNETAATAMNLMKEEMRKIRKNGVTQQEYDDAISYLTGSFPLRIDSNSKIMDHLTSMQMESLGLDYLNDWPDKIRAVTRADVQRVAKRLLHPDSVVMVVVGGGPALEAQE